MISTGTMVDSCAELGPDASVHGNLCCLGAQQEDFCPQVREVLPYLPAQCSHCNKPHTFDACWLVQTLLCHITYADAINPCRFALIRNFAGWEGFDGC
jgi:hypothetical protein